MNLRVIDMVKFYLKQEQFDGLYSDDGECACELADLAPCDNMGEFCRAGYRYWCEDNDCQWTAEAGKHWHMRNVK